MLDWLIVGGGIHGTHLAILLQACGVSASRIRILDPHPSLLARWEERTGRTGMIVLRSPGVHHLAPGPHDLFRFARQARRPPGDTPPFRGKNRRPSLALFQAHARTLVGEWGLEALHLRGTLVGLRKGRGGYQSETSRGSVRARRVVLAMGNALPPLPPWVPPSLAEEGAVFHLFDPRRSPSEAVERARRAGRPVGVVGGGISAAQCALELARSGIATRLIVRHPWRVHRFDADPGWLGPLRLAAFEREADPLSRRAMILAARNRGSVPEEESGRLRALERGPYLKVIRGEPCALQARSERASRGGRGLPDAPGGAPAVRSEAELELVFADAETAPQRLGALLLATGLAAFPLPGPAWTALSDALDLPVLPDGTPLPGRDLSWGPGLHLMGRLADLELGPVAGNVAGARMAARRLISLS